jgi:dTDP-4-amino-4,6-dideoxygalactose transaminase
MTTTRSKAPFLDVRASYLELREELDAAALRVLDSGSYILGEEVEAFEREWAAYCGVEHCIGVGSGLDALTLALVALGIGPGDEVLVPSNTFIATWLAVSHAGARPVPVEPDPSTFNLDPQRLAQARTARTRAILPVHMYGRPADMDPINVFAHEHGLMVLEDAAQSHGAEYRGRRTGGLGNAAAWSFYPGKNLGAFGDGGAITTDDPGMAERLRSLRNYGSKERYRNEMRGFNARLDPLQAAFLRVKLSKLNEWNGRRRLIAKGYSAGLAGADGLTLPPADDDLTRSAWHLYVVRHAARDRLRERLAASGVETLIHYPVPPHRSEAYVDLETMALPVADDLASTVLSLPNGPHLPSDHAQRVARAVVEAAT